MISDRLVYRHRLWVRITHWINVVCMTILLMSGLQIFNAHPALYWGNASDFDHPLAAIGGFPDWATLPDSQWLAMGVRRDKAALSSGWKAHPAIRSRRKQSEQSWR